MVRANGLGYRGARVAGRGAGVRRRLTSERRRASVDPGWRPTPGFSAEPRTGRCKWRTHSIIPPTALRYRRLSVGWRHRRTPHRRHGDAAGEQLEQLPGRPRSRRTRTASARLLHGDAQPQPCRDGGARGPGISRWCRPGDRFRASGGCRCVAVPGSVDPSQRGRRHARRASRADRVSQRPANLPGSVLSAAGPSAARADRQDGVLGRNTCTVWSGRGIRMRTPLYPVAYSFNDNELLDLPRAVAGGATQPGQLLLGAGGLHGRVAGYPGWVAHCQGDARRHRPLW